MAKLAITHQDVLNVYQQRHYLFYRLRENEFVPLSLWFVCPASLIIPLVWQIGVH